MSLVNFMQQFGTLTEPYYFYNGEIEIQFDKKDHVYYLLEDGNLVPLVSVSKVCGIIDKSNMLVPWAAKMMAQKIFKNVPITITKSGAEAVIMLRNDFDKMIMDAKSAHKEKLDDAGEVGKTAHDWIEQQIKKAISLHHKQVGKLKIDEVSKFPKEERSLNCCKAALDWMQHHNVRWIATEQKVYSKKYKYPGTLDGKATVDSCNDPKCCPQYFKDRLSLIDWKSSNGLHDEYILQIAAYEQADREENGTLFEDFWVIRLGKEDGEFEPWHLSWDTVVRMGWKAFLRALDLTSDLAEIDGAQSTRKAAIRAIQKQEDIAERAIKLADACTGSKTYKGVRFPKCNRGNPCKSCLKKYEDSHATH